MAKRVGLILRHGETAVNADNKFRSWSDPPLNAKGKSQAQAAAKFLQKYDIKQVISSPLLRAFVTADICCQKNFVYQTRGLLPWRLGVFTGLDKTDNNDALRLFVNSPDVCIPGGECLSDFENRQFAFWKAALVQARKVGVTLYVAHTSNVTALVNLTEGAHNIEPEFGDSVKPGGIAEIYWDGDHHEVVPVFGNVEEAVFGGS